MKFWCATAFMDTRELIAVSQMLDACGYHGLMVSDHLVYPKVLESKYPYSPYEDGRPMWQPEASWPDPWVLIGAMAAVTTQLHFTTNIYATLAYANNTLYFKANDDAGRTGVELWKSDGSVLGTNLPRDINPTFFFAGPSVLGGGSSPQNLTNVNGTLFFTASEFSTSGSGVELWKSDGTTAGTVLVRDIFGGVNNNSNPANLTNVNGTLFFAANDGLTGTELWKSDGTTTGTVLVRNIAGLISTSSRPSNLTDVNGTLFFTAEDNANGVELWSSNGTTAGTVMVRNINPAVVTGSNPANLLNVNGTLFFTANDGVNGTELWTSNGLTAGTVMVRNINANAGAASLPTGLTNVSGVVYFVADDGVHGRELWRSNGTAAGTVRLADVNAALAAAGLSSFSQLTAIGTTLYFTAFDTTAGTELWRYDAMANSLQRLTYSTDESCDTRISSA